MEKTTLYLPLELQLALKEAAKRQGRTQAELAREALSHYLQSLGRPKLRSIGTGDDPHLSARDYESWLETRDAAERHGRSIHAYVFMINHVHVSGVLIVA